MTEPVTIERISREEFDAVAKWSIESQAIRKLQPGEAIKYPCRWKHSGNTKSCHGAAMAAHAAKRENIHIRFRCYNGSVYVLRLEEGGE